jgi:hypothetical protein
MKYDPSTNSFSTPIPSSGYTEEEALALLRKNGRNHPLTRESTAAKAVRQFKEQQAREKALQNKQG